MKRAYIKRFAICVLGLACSSVGNVFGIHAGATGTNAWNTLSLGVASATSLSFGAATLMIGVLVVLIDIAFKGQIGFGTLLNATLIPLFTDLFLAVSHSLPTAQNQFIGVALTVIGQIIISFSTVFYMSAGLGCGPRDTLMVIVGKRFPKAPIGFIRFCIELAVMLIGVLLGAPFGLGSVLVMGLQASLFQLACRVCRYEPRNIEHESMITTISRL